MNQGQYINAATIFLVGDVIIKEVEGCEVILLHTLERGLCDEIEHIIRNLKILIRRSIWMLRACLGLI